MSLALLKNGLQKTCAGADIRFRDYSGRLGGGAGRFNLGPGAPGTGPSVPRCATRLRKKLQDG
jgi:hypothetical protein